MHYHPSQPLPRGDGGGYLDRFGNEWIAGPAHGIAAANGDVQEWDVRLSKTGVAIWSEGAKVVNGVSYVNVTKVGHLSHK